MQPELPDLAPPEPIAAADTVSRPEPVVARSSIGVSPLVTALMMCLGVLVAASLATGTVPRSGAVAAPTPGVEAVAGTAAGADSGAG